MGGQDLKLLKTMRLLSGVWPDAAILRHLGNFGKPKGTFFFWFIDCYELFGQSSYLLVAISSKSLFTIGPFY